MTKGVIMMLHNDCHVHSRGDEKTSDIVRAMDEGEVEKMVLFAPHGDTPEKMREATDFVAHIQAEAPDRILGFCWIEPRHEGAVEELERAIADKKLVGCKMIPNHWYPYDELVFPVYEKAQELRIPIIFHSGILWGFEDSSRFCRPCFYEALIHFPKLKFALAHIGWPWTDECLATAGRFRFASDCAGAALQMYIDLTPGAPGFYREEVLTKTLKYLGSDGVMWGSDAHALTVGKFGKEITCGKEFYFRERVLLRDVLSRSEEDMEKVFSKNLVDFMKPLD
jgi:predicted TIM-barrel fold metal-dependent hydrolase